MVVKRTIKPTIPKNDANVEEVETKLNENGQENLNTLEDNNVGTEIEDTANKSKTARSGGNKAESEDDVINNLSDAQLAKLAQRMGVVYNAPKAKLGTSTAKIKIYNGLPLIAIGKCKEGQVLNKLMNTMETKLVYPVTTCDGVEHLLEHDEYNSLEKQDFEFTRRTAGLVQELGEPIYNPEKKEYVKNVANLSDEIYMVKIDDKVYEINSKVSPLNA